MRFQQMYTERVHSTVGGRGGKDNVKLAVVISLANNLRLYRCVVYASVICPVLPTSIWYCF